VLFSETISPISISSSAIERLIEVIVNNNKLKRDVMQSGALKFAVVLILTMRTNSTFKPEIDFMLIVDGREMLKIK